MSPRAASRVANYLQKNSIASGAGVPFTTHAGWSRSFFSDQFSTLYYLDLLASLDAPSKVANIAPASPRVKIITILNLNV